MKESAYAIEAEVEANHWWFVGRRHLFKKEINRLNLPPAADIVDLGLGTGSNLRLFRELGFINVIGLDMSEYAASVAREKGARAVCLGNVCALPFRSASFDLVLAADILEHVDDDRGAIAEIIRVLRPGGHALVTVPTFPVLWGLQDEVAMHKRRYYKRPLAATLSEMGMRVCHSFYFNYLLFIPILLARSIIRWFRLPVSNENNVNNPIINMILTHVFRFDVLTARHIRPPFGVSALLLVRTED